MRNIKRNQWIIVCLGLLLSSPTLYAQDFLQKAKNHLDAGECDKAKVAYEAYKVENPQGNAEVASLIEMCVKCPSFLYDYDNNEYRVVHIGKQCWMAENLRTTHYDNGKNISLSRELSDTKAYYYYAEGRSVTKESYGLLYNWRAVMGDNYSPSSNLSRVQGVCPKGWHVPNDSEWQQLREYVYSRSEFNCEQNDMSSIAKALASTFGWNNSNNPCAVGNNQNDNNATGFAAPPAGLYAGGFGAFGDRAFFWSTTEKDAETAWCRFLDCDVAGEGHGANNKMLFFSVRCLRDE